MNPSALGRYLRESREAKELTLEDAVRALRIRRDILESFEQGEFDGLDSAVRVRGMLRNYAHYLGLDEERVLQYYEAAITGNRRKRRFGRRKTAHAEPIAPRKITDTPPSLPAVRIQPVQSSGSIGNALRNIAMFLVSVAALAVIIYVLADTLELGQFSDSSALVPTIPAGEMTITSTNTPTITPRATILTDTPSASSFNIDGVQVVVEINQRSWVRILADDAEQYIGFLEPGYSATYSGNNSVAITAANAAALDITYNGVSQDPFGVRGQQVELIFTLSGIDVTQGEGGLLPTEMSTDEEIATSEVTEPVQVVTPTASQADNTSESVVSAQIQTSNTPISSGLPTPTPLFPVDSSSDDAPVATNANDSSIQSESSTTQEGLSATVDTTASQETVEPSPTDTATPSAILPLRETQPPTPTKPA